MQRTQLDPLTFLYTQLSFSFHFSPLLSFEYFFFRPDSGVRPFGVSLLVAGFDDNGPQLYQVWHMVYFVICIVFDQFALELFKVTVVLREREGKIEGCFWCNLFLLQVDPSGSYFSWKASAMGKTVSNAKTFLEKRYAFTLMMAMFQANMRSLSVYNVYVCCVHYAG